MPDPITPAPVVPAPNAPVVTPPAPVTPTADPVTAPPTLLTDPPKPDGAPGGDPAAPAELKITVPEGFQIDAKRLESFVTFAKDHKIPAEGAQKFFDQFVEQQQQEASAAQMRRAEMVTGWAEESKKSFGKDFDTTIASAKKALQRFGDPELASLIETSGLGNHKAVIALLAKVGAKIKEDVLPAVEGPAGTRKTEADQLKVMYDKSPDMAFGQ